MTRATRADRAPQPAPLSFTVELPSLPPTVNLAYVNYGNGRRGPSHAARAWKQGAWLAIQAEIQAAGWSAAKGQALAVEMWVYDPLPLKLDLDNVPKVLFDALKAATKVDDRYIVDAFLRKRRADETKLVLKVTKVEFAL